MKHIQRSQVTSREKAVIEVKQHVGSIWSRAPSLSFLFKKEQKSHHYFKNYEDQQRKTALSERVAGL